MPSRREELQAQLAEEERREREERDRFEVEIGQDGSYARVPYEKAKSWLKKTFDIDLDEEPAQDAPDASKDEPDGSRTVRFGRRTA